MKVYEDETMNKMLNCVNYSVQHYQCYDNIYVYCTGRSYCRYIKQRWSLVNRENILHTKHKQNIRENLAGILV